MGLGIRFNLKVLVKKFSPYLPLTYTDMIARSLKGCRSILDVGCGRGELMESLNRRVSAYRVGLDLYHHICIKQRKDDPMTILYGQTQGGSQ